MSSSSRIWPGNPYPLGATYDGVGFNFAVFSEEGQRVELCLFDSAESATERERIELPEKTAHVFHGYLPALKPGQAYGYRVHGPWAPRAGLRFNPYKLLVDPYAQAIANEVDWSAPMLPYLPGGPDGDLTMDTRDNAAGAPKSIVVDNVFNWRTTGRRASPCADVIYEVHVKGSPCATRRP